jgi:hypothetical protein
VLSILDKKIWLELQITGAWKDISIKLFMAKSTVPYIIYGVIARSKYLLYFSKTIKLIIVSPFGQQKNLATFTYSAEILPIRNS